MTDADDERPTETDADALDPHESLAPLPVSGSDEPRPAVAVSEAGLSLPLSPVAAYVIAP